MIFASGNNSRIRCGVHTLGDVIFRPTCCQTQTSGQQTSMKMEGELGNTKHELLKVREMLDMAEKVWRHRLRSPTLATCMVRVCHANTKCYTYWRSVCVHHINGHRRRCRVIQELEKKVSQTAPFRNLKQMLQKKNEQIKDLRRRLSRCVWSPQDAGVARCDTVYMFIHDI